MLARARAELEHDRVDWDVVPVIRADIARMERKILEDEEEERQRVEPRPEWFDDDGGYSAGGSRQVEPRPEYFDDDGGYGAGGSDLRAEEQGPVEIYPELEYFSDGSDGVSEEGKVDALQIPSDPEVDDDAEEAGEPVCGVCFYRKINVVVRPCRHVRFCRRCLGRIFFSKAKPACPSCKEKMSGFETVCL
ncbi:hypothetical protein U1Q18_046374 [Sarracenia purpurea var. burkii]